MPSRPFPDFRQGFIDIVANLNLLGHEAADGLLREAATRDESPFAVALKGGMLDPVQVDIIETLLRPTETVPGYEILDLIGRGGMGIVYRARQQNLDRIVALKTVLVERMDDPKMVSRFEREAKMVARLRHPNIVAAHDFGRHAGRLYFVMGLVEGPNLQVVIARRNQLDELSALRLAQQVASGLAHAEQLGIVHRDIKPANLLLSRPPAGHLPSTGLPMVKIADFGLAFLATEQETRHCITAENTAIGSPHYMAPEQLDHGTIDHRADIYSLGATMFHMLTGRPPFDGETLPQTLSMKLSSETPELRDVRPDILAGTASLVTSMLQRDPGQRVQNYESLLAQIDALTHSVRIGQASYVIDE